MWFPVDKVRVAPLIEHPPGAVILLSKQRDDLPAGIAIRFDCKVGENTERLLFYPGGFPWARDESFGSTINLENWRDRDTNTPAYIDQTASKARLEISSDNKNANYVDEWKTPLRGRVYFGQHGVRILSGNSNSIQPNLYAIDPVTWRAERENGVPKIAWADSWRLVFGDATNPTIVFEHTIHAEPAARQLP